MRAAHISGWVNGAAVFEDFEVNVRPRGTTRTAHQRNNIAAPDQITHLNHIALIMGVSGTEPVAMGDLDHGAVTRPITTPAHHSARHRKDIGPCPTSKIGTFVPCAFTGDWINASAVG
jgi:hypothetical protein